MQPVVSGYGHPLYAEAFSTLGTPVELPGCGGWLLRRPIPGTDLHDAMGCYPLFSCRDWSRLPDDLSGLEHELVAVAAVLDPFGDYREADLRRCFPDLLIPFKQHFVVDLSRPQPAALSPHHRRYARRSLREVQVELSPDPPAMIEDWVGLYENLMNRHAISGVLEFSRASFAQQLRVPGMVTFRAVCQGATVGMLLWYVQGPVAYYHLGAFSPLGYRLRASFALFWTAIQHFGAERLQWLDLGAGAGVREGGDDGLSRFKRGWSSLTRTAYFCGRIFDREAYDRIVRDQGLPATRYFPAYRRGEFS